MRFAIAVAILVFATRAVAQVDERDVGLRRLERLTASTANQLLGQLTPDGKTLYFLSDRNTTHELFEQSISTGRTRRLFDEAAEVTWPRVSPDGKKLLYVSFRDRATGQLCVRDLPQADGRRCLEDNVTTIQAEWIDTRRAVLVARTSADSNLRVLEVTMGGRLTTRPLFDRNAASPAVSPDGRWVVYVPIARYAERVGPAFAATASDRLAFVDLQHPGTPVELTVDLPGQTSEPAFSRDGRYLYLVQFISDTNHDGVLDANDNGVLFRVPLRLDPPRAGVAEQLTETSWNCQYPAPTPREVVATCTRSHTVDIYTLPLDGEIPGEWNEARVSTEIGLATTHAEEQILYYRRLLLETGTSARRLAMVDLVRLHLDLDEYRAAAFYAEHIAAMRDASTAGIASALGALVEQRRAVRRRERGRMDEDFRETALARLDGLRDTPHDSPGAVVLRHVVRSEIADTTGDKGRARSELAAAVVDDTTPRSVLRFYYERADALYRELDDRAPLVAVCARLAALPQLEPNERLDYARAAVRSMTRGMPLDEAMGVVTNARSAASDPELVFALDLARRVLSLRDDAASSEPLLALYASQTRADRRRALVLDAVRQAERVSADHVIEQLAVRWMDDATGGDRRQALRLFRRALTSRAYRRVAAGQVTEARADFDAVAKTGSIESMVASIDLRLREGAPLASIRADYEAHATSYRRPALELERVYLDAAQLPDLEGRAFDQGLARTRETLRAAWADLGNERVARGLLAALLHRQFLRTGDMAFAQRADLQDRVALDLFGQNARYRATLLGNAGMLQEAVGNHRIALTHLNDRDALPYFDDAPSLGARMAYARALFHVGRNADAAHVADEALASADRTAALAPYRILALDRAALYNLAEGNFARALALYDRELPLVEAEPAGRRNAFVVRLARAAAALGAGQPRRALDDIAVIEPRLDAPTFTRSLEHAHASRDQIVLSYRLLLTGLRARASHALGATEAERRALEQRRALLLVRMRDVQQGADLRAVALVESQLTRNALARGDDGAAAMWVRTAVGHADDLRIVSNGVPDYAQLDVAWLASELNAFVGVAMPVPVAAHLDRARIDAATDPRFRTYLRWFEVTDALRRP